MEYINKQSQQGEKIIKDWLDSLNASGRTYPDYLYENIPRDIKSEIKDILIAEQNGRCCYCMRRLKNDGTTTREHLIPNKTKDQVEFNEYLIPQTILNNNVCFAPDFITNQVNTYPPYPHTVAYHNLTASCDGKINGNGKSLCCNLKRGNKFIDPIVLYPNIRNEIVYSKNGYAKYPNDKSNAIEGTLGVLGLNDPKLIMIRKLLIFANSQDITDLNKTDKDKFIPAAIVIFEKNEYKLLKSFQNITLWSLLKEYDYFLGSPNIKS